MADLIYMVKSKWTALLDSIRAKGGTSALMTADQAKAAVDAIPSGGGGATVDDICDRSWITGEQTIEEATTIGRYAFAEVDGLTKISSSSVTTILERAFYGCSNLEEVSFPELTSIRVYAGSTALSEARTFTFCEKLKKFYAPKLEYIYGTYVFARLYSISACTSDCVFVFPAIKELGLYTFETCLATLFDFGPGLTTIRSDTFYGRVAAAQRNKTLILRRNASVVAAQSTDSIREVVDVYCPSALVSSYQTATNWKTRYDGGYITFHAIEGSQYETAYADGTPVT